jgi:uncharacterized protein with HEPN domain
MRPQSSDISYLWDMLDASKAIRHFLVGKTFAEYDTDRLLRGAVERHIEIIGEAARNVSEIRKYPNRFQFPSWLPAF